MKRVLILLVVVCFFNPAISQSTFKAKESTIDSIMRSHILHTGKKPVHSFLLYAKNGKNGFEIKKGIGTVGRNDKVVDADFQYNCASITKTFVATIILQLEEEKKLSLSDKAYAHLKELPYARFDQVHIFNDTNFSKEITIEQLLQHTSGIADIFTDAATKFNLSVLLHKKRQFNTKRIVNRFFHYHLNKKPKNKPGKGYHYSDMNYLMLGLIIESITKKTLPQAIRERILEKAGMKSTYFEYYEPAITQGKRVDAYIGKINMTKKINTSYEWGGGGLVTTTKDLGMFIEWLFESRFFEKPETISKMTDFTNTKAIGANYGLGLFSFEVNGKTYFGHGGFYGSALLYDPKHKITFSANIAQANAPYDTTKLIKEILEVITAD